MYLPRIGVSWLWACIWSSMRPGAFMRAFGGFGHPVAAYLPLRGVFSRPAVYLSSGKVLRSADVSGADFGHEKPADGIPQPVIDCVKSLVPLTPSPGPNCTTTFSGCQALFKKLFKALIKSLIKALKNSITAICIYAHSGGARGFPYLLFCACRECQVDAVYRFIISRILPAYCFLPAVDLCLLAVYGLL